MKDAIVFRNVSKVDLRDIRITKLRTFYSILFGLKKNGHMEGEYLIRDLSFTLKEGETLLVVGGENSGKETLARLICGLSQPTTGVVRVEGTVRWVVSTPVGSNPLMSVEEYLRLLLMLCGEDADRVETTKEEILRDCNLKEFNATKLFDVPDWMLKKLVYYTMITVDADVFVFEHTRRFDDPEFASMCMKRIDHIMQNRTVVVLKRSIGELDSLMARYVDKVLVLEDGCSRFFGSFEDTTEKSFDEMAGNVHHAGRYEGSAEQRTLCSTEFVIGNILKEWKRSGYMLEDLIDARLNEAFSGIDNASHVVAGPYISDTGTEFIYWIPFLRWVMKRFNLKEEHLTAISRCGAGVWYRRLGMDYTDMCEVMEEEEMERYFRDITLNSSMKQFEATPFEMDLVRRLLEKKGIEEYFLIHPSLMWNLFLPVWKQMLPTGFLFRYISYDSFNLNHADHTLPLNLPERYIAVKFSFCPHFPPTEENIRFVREFVGMLSKRHNVVSLHTAKRIDKHEDFIFKDEAVYTIDEGVTYSNLLDIQTRVIKGAELCIGVHGNITSIAPFMGVNTLNIYSHMAGTYSVTHSIYDTHLSGVFKEKFFAVNVNETSPQELIRMVDR